VPKGRSRELLGKASPRGRGAVKRLTYYAPWSGAIPMAVGSNTGMLRESLLHSGSHVLWLAWRDAFGSRRVERSHLLGWLLTSFCPPGQGKDRYGGHRTRQSGGSAPSVRIVLWPPKWQLMPQKQA
jgi:hypothetical protein